MPTGAGVDRAGNATAAGLNQIYVWFMQVPQSKPLAAGIARLAVVPVTLKGATRTPPDAALVLGDADLVILP